MHTDMFNYGHSRREVRDAMLQHQKRDSKVLNVLDLMFGACVLFLVRRESQMDAAVIVLAVVAGVSGMRYFIDQSVRNFYLHRLD